MSNDIAVRHDQDMDLATLGKMLSQSGYFQDAKDAAQAVVKVLAGREVGLPPIASMTGIHIVKGKVTFAAATVAALIQRSGVYHYRVMEHTDSACEIVFTESGREVGRSRFTMEDAGRAGLVGQNPTWKSYPRNMVFARALTNGARWYCPAVFGGPVYTPDELRHGDVDEMPDAPPAPISVDPHILNLAVGAARDVLSGGAQKDPNASANSLYDQNIADRERLLEQIKVDSLFLGLTDASRTVNWKRHVGANVSETAAPIAGLVALAAHLAERVTNVKKGQATTLSADPVEPVPRIPDLRDDPGKQVREG